jgi:hypothetical protein
MNQTRKPMRADVSGLKWAISTAALAATIGGWGWLTAQNPPEVAIAAPQIAVQPPAVERQPLPPWLTDDPMLPVLPTVVPLNIPARDQVAAPARASGATTRVSAATTRVSRARASGATTRASGASIARSYHSGAGSGASSGCSDPIITLRRHRRCNSAAFGRWVQQ